MNNARRPFQIERRRGHAAPTSLAVATRDDVSGDGLTEIKAAIEALRVEMRDLAGSASPPATPPAPAGIDPEVLRKQIVEAETLRKDLEELHRAIEETKLEIASLRRTDSSDDKLTTASEALRAIVGDTERATDGIINAAETVEELAGRLRATVEGSDTEAIVDELYEQVTTIFEHCNFQDITGQRITKVVNTMEYIDDRVQRMMSIWGGDTEFEKIAVTGAEERPAGEVLHGPATEGDASISQADIDALFD